MSKITIIIPCYNSEKYISKCIKGLAEQTYKDFDVIFVDDCSSDGTVSVLNKLKTTSNFNFRILKNEQNSGPAISRNRGIEVSRSEYIAFCDSDDWYESDFLENMMSLIEKSDSDICFCGYRVVDVNNHYQLRPPSKIGVFKEKKEAISIDVDSLCMSLVKKELFNNIKIPDVRNGEDMAVVPLLIMNSRTTAVTNKCMYNYSRRSTSASQRPNPKVVDQLIKSYEYLYSCFPKGYDSELEYLGIRNLLYPSIISLFSFSFDKTKANEILDNFILLFPGWNNNPLISILPLYKRIILKLLSKRLYLLIRLIALWRNRLTGIF